jgi:hypothetical protein
MNHVRTTVKTRVWYGMECEKKGIKALFFSSHLSFTRYKAARPIITDMLPQLIQASNFPGVSSSRHSLPPTAANTLPITTQDTGSIIAKKCCRDFLDCVFRYFPCLVHTDPVLFPISISPWFLFFNFYQRWQEVLYGNYVYLLYII